MSNVVLITGKYSNGEQFQMEVPFDIRELNLSGRNIAEIDLSALKGCKHLVEFNMSHNQLKGMDLSFLESNESIIGINLYENQLETIDLSPLKDKQTLRHLDLHGNPLRTVDLTPLKGLKRFNFLYLYNCNLEMIDLTPLGECPDLSRAEFHQNRIKTIDLTPLKHCKGLMRLKLNENQLAEIDLSPLAEVPNLEMVNLDQNQLRVVDLTPLKPCREVAITLDDNPILTDEGHLQWHVVFQPPRIPPLSIERGVLLRVEAHGVEDAIRWFEAPDMDVHVPTLQHFREQLEDRIQFVIHAPKILVEKMQAILGDMMTRRTSGFVAELVECIAKDPKFGIVSADIGKKDPLQRKLMKAAPQLSYLILGTAIIMISMVLGDILGVKSVLIAEEMFQFVFIAVIGIQLFQGIMIQSYVERTIQKVERAMHLGERTLKRFNVPTNRLKSIIGGLRLHFGVLVSFIWLFAVYSLLRSLTKNPKPDLESPNWTVVSTLSSLLDLVAIIGTPLPEIFPDLIELLSNFIFGGFLGILVRVIPLLLMFFAVYQYGWGTLLHQSKKEMRELGEDKVDWYEYLALLIGLVLVILVVGYELTGLSELPVSMFKLGLIIGGIGYLLFNQKQARWFLQTLLLVMHLLFAYFFGIILLNLVQKNNATINFELRVLVMIISMMTWTYVIFRWYLGGWPFKKQLSKRSLLHYMMKANEDYHDVVIRGARSRLHRWLFSDNDKLTAFVHQGTLHVNNHGIYPANVVTLGLVFIITPIFLISFLSALTMQLVLVII